MSSPTLICHQKSGSMMKVRPVTAKTAETSSIPSIAGKEKTDFRILDRRDDSPLEQKSAGAREETVLGKEVPAGSGTCVLSRGRCELKFPITGCLGLQVPIGDTLLGPTDPS